MGSLAGSNVGYWYGCLVAPVLVYGVLINCVGGSALMAVEVLKSRGVPEDHILFLNLIASPEGIKKFAVEYPKVRVVTAFVDQGLDEKKYVFDHPLNVPADQV